MTGYEINISVTKKFGVILSPNIIYSKIISLERKKLIACVSHDRGRKYVLTVKGRRIVEEFDRIVEESQLIVKFLFIF